MTEFLSLLALLILTLPLLLIPVVGWGLFIVIWLSFLGEAEII